MATTDNKIYLIGSYHGFRDRIIEALPHCSFADPRLHRQSSVAKLVHDDLTQAEQCPIALGVFPKGKSRGVMSYVELGVSFAHGNHLIIADEDNEKDEVLRKISDLHVATIDTAIEHLQTYNHAPKGHNLIQRSYPAGHTGPVELGSVLICPGYSQELQDYVHEAQKIRPDRGFTLTQDVSRELSGMSSYDLLVAHFPEGADWNRHACLLMGAAYAHDISILLIDEHEWRYPPLQAVARRHCTIDGAFDYMTEVDDLNIASEARNMYQFFKREQERAR